MSFTFVLWKVSQDYIPFYDFFTFFLCIFKYFTKWINCFNSLCVCCTRCRGKAIRTMLPLAVVPAVAVSLIISVIRIILFIVLWDLGTLSYHRDIKSLDLLSNCIKVSNICFHFFHIFCLFESSICIAFSKYFCISFISSSCMLHLSSMYSGYLFNLF